jgi:hypothetical protein
MKWLIEVLVLLTAGVMLARPAAESDKDEEESNLSSELCR